MRGKSEVSQKQRVPLLGAPRRPAQRSHGRAPRQPPALLPQAGRQRAQRSAARAAVPRSGNAPVGNARVLTLLGAPRPRSHRAPAASRRRSPGRGGGCEAGPLPARRGPTCRGRPSALPLGGDFPRRSQPAAMPAPSLRRVGVRPRRRNPRPTPSARWGFSPLNAAHGKGCFPASVVLAKRFFARGSLRSVLP